MRIPDWHRGCRSTLAAVLLLAAQLAAAQSWGPSLNGSSAKETANSATVIDLAPCSSSITTDERGRKTVTPTCTTEACIKQCNALRAQAAKRSAAGTLAQLPRSRTPVPSTAPSVPVPQLAPVPSPTAVTSCDAAGCLGADGSRFNGNGAMVNSQGRLCSRTGEFIQCF